MCPSVCLCGRMYVLTHDVDEGAAEDGVEAAEHRVRDPSSEHGHEVARTCGVYTKHSGWEHKRNDWDQCSG